MPATLIIRPEAEQDTTEAYDWYEGRQTGLGARFLRHVEACLRAVCDNPEGYATVHENYRRALVRKFPYSVFYEYADGTVTVYSVFHNSQNPAKWRRRLP
jgi:plasmid stabilization system protein ParE